MPTLGLALGALGSAALVQYAPSPTSLVFIVFVVLFVVLGGASLVVPETVQKRPGALASLRPQVGIPVAARGPSLVTGVLGQQNHLVGGFGVATLMLVGTAASLLVRDIDPRRAMTVGSGLLALGTVLTLTGLETGSLAVFFAGTAVAGAGFGSAFLGAFRSLAGLAAPAERAELFSVVYVVSYLAFSIPAVVAGFCIPKLGLLDTALGYGVGVVTLAVAATVLQPLRARSAARALAPELG